VEEPFEAVDSNSRWLVGYCGEHDLDAFDTDSQLHSAAALRVRQGLLARPDLVG